MIHQLSIATYPLEGGGALEPIPAETGPKAGLSQGLMTMRFYECSCLERLSQKQPCYQICEALLQINANINVLTCSQ